VMALRLEFAGQHHPVGREIERIWETGVKRCVRLINAGRKAGSIPPGPPRPGDGTGVAGRARGSRDRTRRTYASRRAPGRTCRCGGAGDRQPSSRGDAIPTSAASTTNGDTDSRQVGSTRGTKVEPRSPVLERASDAPAVLAASSRAFRGAFASRRRHPGPQEPRR
jgi:hypothetical protein